MFTGMIFIFAPLVVGYLFSISNIQTLEFINRSTSRLIYVILALMGLSLAALDNLGSNLQTILLYTVTFFVCLGACNLMALPAIDKLLPLQTDSSKKKLPLSSMAMESAKLILVVGSGLIAGLVLPIGLDWVDTASEWILFVLLFFIGIQLRNSGLTLRQILLNKHGMVIAVTIVITSLVGGVIAAYLLDIPLFKALAMSSGFGWYSLAGILMGDAFGPVYGGASFMLELLRELVALVLIPVLIRSYPCTSIGYAGATAMDFTLPVIQTTGGVRCVPIAIVSGFILSLLVPILMLFFVSLAN
ncbi:MULTISPECIES: lysine exporter LysO family protein [Vibrio]|uniref:Lysine exporter LysO family protein n=3 Tax=Vibrio cyclitrophicus TaxID=47951 RepID=A0A7Z1S0W9_9VIBR|nr:MULTISPECIES: lysine exporter LysO family protein [Vibrio]KNH13645.1 membrane protein [Vibrio lentus]MBY7659973.1 lysine exporter LysO family protein [Vibrio atlanticus]ERM61121.1 putative surface protein [Vibrio cyclitrophicus FF75]MBE8555247.1 lysine exporter LysO family protein [Vibrio sp. OPT24]MBE8605700.1 lysine exporter LysO family protein [Vibrio sp. OPT10]|tara:strand:+ start:1199 stop:2104 length:906 start_codon:yes stop_codon:yes gene_type:complete